MACLPVLVFEKKGRPRFGAAPYLTQSSRLRISIQADLALRCLRVVLFGLRDRNVHVGAVISALVPSADREHRRRRAAVLTHETTHVSEAMAATKEPERSFPEQLV